MCSAITKMHNCQSVAFIKGGPEGGAYSGAAAVALACNKIYMSGATVIGAATVIDGRGYDLEKTRGVNLSEKIRSAWRNYMASLAEQNHRPVAFARAMENKDIEILEVRRDGKTHYIESGEKKSTDSVVRVRKPKGQIVTLPAGEAVEYGVADKVVSSLQDVLADRNATDANVIRPNQMTLAKEEFDKVNRKFEKLKNSLDTKFHTLSAKSRNGGITINDAKKAFKGIIQEMKYLIRLKKTYPDVPCEEEDLQDTINAIQAEYESL
jgi:membrane-bound ClpP family serine protease